ncbi:MAG TPA: hypothetical protein P5534_11270 [Candidatus Paceibacterota bacterium]|nr:hypothetical protein [Candidatus Paceibacterota bacterium]HRZ55830.1 hypothetical protein [Candidatus Paceibacterota bacterium]
MYRCVAGSIEGFVRQLAVAYVGHGYYFYVTGWIPPHKVPERIDEKIIRRYDIDISRWTRARRKKQGCANVQYLRFDRFFVIIATQGRHRFFEAEGAAVKDIREAPIHFHRYSIGYRPGWRSTTWHPSVRIDAGLYAKLEARFEGLALHRAAEAISAEFRGLPFEPWAPVRRQLWRLLRLVNQRRKLAGLELVPISAVGLRRRPSQPFDRKRGCEAQVASAGPVRRAGGPVRDRGEVGGVNAHL